MRRKQLSFERSQVASGGPRRKSSLIVAGANAALFGTVVGLAFAGLRVPEPWDLVAYGIVAIVCPFGGLLVTLSFAFREMRAGLPKKEPLLAVALSMTVFLVGLSFLVVRD